jgi:hypothetical protein
MLQSWLPSKLSVGSGRAVSTVFWVLLPAGYVVIATMTWRRAAWVFADKERLDPQGRFTTFEIIWGLVLGAAFAILWPVTLAIYVIRTHGVPLVGNRFFLPPPHVRREQEARQTEERQRRIAELERETELR